MINKLIKLADFLDSVGVAKAADQIDSVLMKISQVQEIGPDTDSAIEQRIQELSNAWIIGDWDLLGQVGLNKKDHGPLSLRHVFERMLDSHSDPISLLPKGWYLSRDSRDGNLDLMSPSGLAGDDGGTVIGNVALYLVLKIEEQMKLEDADTEEMESPLNPPDPVTLDELMSPPEPKAYYRETGHSFEFPEEAAGLHADIR